MNVILIGFMGAGKTTVGHFLARSLDFSFVDTDARIEAAAGRTIPEIFSTEGEPGFRDLETAALLEALRGDRRVISTGGGIVLRPENRAAIRAGGYCVWLAASPETVWERVSGDDQRPLLRTADPRGTIRKMLAERDPLYEETALLRVQTGEFAAEDIAYGIAESVRAYFREPADRS